MGLAKYSYLDYLWAIEDGLNDSNLTPAEIREMFSLSRIVLDDLRELKKERDNHILESEEPTEIDRGLPLEQDC
jgi:hypothetical protein